MPELPEVETMRRGLLGAVAATVVHAAREPCRRRPIAVSPRIDAFRRRVAGRQLTAVDRVGKRVVLRLSSGDAVVIEPRMTGLVLVSDPPTVEHLRFRLDLRGASVDRIWFWDRRGLGSVRLLTPAQAQQQLGAPHIGPDALEIAAEQLRESLRESRREVKVALLDQRVVAGIGNLYASELLHVAEVHPQSQCRRLTLAQWRRICDAARHVLQEAITYEGSTLADGTYRNALNQAGSYQNHHRVYDREGDLCSRCQAGVIRRIVQAQRSTFFCPRCQRKRDTVRVK